MARITTAGDRRVTTAADVRVTNDGLVTFATLSQSVRLYYPAATVATLDQTVYVYYPAATVATLQQAVRLEPVVYPAATAATLDQTVELLLSYPAESFATIAQDVRRHEPAETIATLQQRVLSPAAVATNTTFVTLAGQDITANVAPAISITATEGDNRTASVRLVKLPKGPLDVPAYQGQSVEITRLIDGAPVVLFTGTVERPTYNRDQRSLLLECSDLRNERIGKENRDQLKAMTGGLFSAITQRDDAVGEAWVAELMRTVEGSLDYTGNGVLRYRPWALGTPARTLTDADIHYREIQLEFATRSEIVNTISATLEYRYYLSNTLLHGVSASVRKTSYGSGGEQLPDSNDSLPTKSAMVSAVQSVSGWRAFNISINGLPANGWYRNKASAFPDDKVGYFANDVVRATRGTGVSATLVRWVSQPRREIYDIAVTAPQSVEQFGEIVGADMRFAVETRIDPAAFEERGYTIPADNDDRRGDVVLAIQCIQRMASKRIRASHRQNLVSVRYKRDLLPVEIGDAISISAGEIQAAGFVTSFEHRATAAGDLWTDISLSVSRAESGVSVAEDWSPPAEPNKFVLNPGSEPPESANYEGRSRITSDGTVIIVAPRINRAWVDEIQGERSATYNVAIPQNPLAVEVV